MSPRIFATGATLHDASQSWKGYVLHGAPTAARTSSIREVDRSGSVVWSWSVAEHLEQFGIRSSWVFRAQPIPYDWVPDGTPRSERDIRELAPATFRLPR